MAKIENSVFIERSPEDVFDYLVDMRNELAWNPDVQSMQKLTDGPIDVGTKFLAKWKQSKVLEVECLEYDRPRQWRYANGGPLVVVVTVELAPRDGGTDLKSTFDVTPEGFIRLVFPVLLQILKRAERRNMQHIKRALEVARTLAAESTRRSS